MPVMHRLLILLTGLIFCPLVMADSIPMSDYIRLKTGMTEAEVLYRVGLYDHETVATDYFHNVLQKTWYYIPAQSEISNARWITEIVFDGAGRVITIDRYKPWGNHHSAALASSQRLSISSSEASSGLIPLASSCSSI